MKILETERLILRTWQDSDFAPFSMMNQDSKVMEFFPALLTSVETKLFFDEFKLHFAIHGFCPYAVQLKKSGEFIGFIGFKIPSFETKFTPCVEIGWRLVFKYWGKGYAFEGAKACLDYGFDKLKFKEILSWTAKVNLRSINVMEKIGMKRDFKNDFLHPRIALGHPLSQHVLYRIGSNVGFVV